jgi:hypothetical protein
VDMPPTHLQSECRELEGLQGRGSCVGDALEATRPPRSPKRPSATSTTHPTPGSRYPALRAAAGAARVATKRRGRASVACSGQIQPAPLRRRGLSRLREPYYQGHPGVSPDRTHDGLTLGYVIRASSSSSRPSFWTHNYMRVIS